MSRMFEIDGKTWEPIPMWPDYYACREGLIASTKWGTLKVMSPIPSKDGHLYVFLYRHGEMFKKWVHQLILTTFVGDPKLGEESRHLNGNPFENRVDNLAWGTRQDNADDRVKHGRTPQGEKSGTHKLTAEQVLEIRRVNGRETSRALGIRYGVSHTTILAAAKGEHWSCL